LGDVGKGAPLGSNDEVDKTMKKYAFNRWASDKMSLKRSLPDVRHASCRNIDYDKELPKVN
jgi:polypeptide N-acetylgalactosaminyltransferase